MEAAWANSKTSGMIECVHTGGSALQTQTHRYRLIVVVIYHDLKYEGPINVGEDRIYMIRMNRGSWGHLIHVITSSNVLMMLIKPTVLKL